MAYFVFLLLGMLGGGFCVYIVLDRMRKATTAEAARVLADANKVREAWELCT